MADYDIEKIYKRLEGEISQGKLARDGNMAEFTSFKTGGNADIILEPWNGDELKCALQVLAEENMEHIVLGNGTNVLVRDGGYRGAVVKLGEAFSGVCIEGCTMVVKAGTILALASKEALSAGLSGLEFAGGIPGSVGGGLFMNAGAYGGEMAQIVKCAKVLSRDGAAEQMLSAVDMKLSYRHSIFQETGQIILEAQFSLQFGEKTKIGARMKELTVKRNEKQPVNLPSAGSFFKRPDGYFAGKLIEDAGLSGLSLGGAQISPLHAGFIVNNGTATATDIINLMEIVQHTVYDRFGVGLLPEVRIIGE